MYGEFQKLPSPSKFQKLARVEGRGTDAYFPTQICCLVQHLTLAIETVVALTLFEYSSFNFVG